MGLRIGHIGCSLVGEVQGLVAEMQSSTLAPLIWIVPLQRAIAALQNSKLVLQNAKILVQNEIAVLQRAIAWVHA
jgi:hypothetical protein